MKHSLSSRIVRFLLVGTGVAVFQIVTFAVLFSGLGFHYQSSTTLSFVVTIIVSYVSQRYITYKVEGEERKNSVSISLILFSTSVIVGFFILNIVMYVGVEMYEINEYILQIIAMMMIAIYNFLFFHVVFR